MAGASVAPDCELPELARAYDDTGALDSAVAVYERYLATPDIQAIRAGGAAALSKKAGVTSIWHNPLRGSRFSPAKPRQWRQRRQFGAGPLPPSRLGLAR